MSDEHTPPSPTSGQTPSGGGAVPPPPPPPPPVPGGVAPAGSAGDNPKNWMGVVEGAF